MFDPKKVPAKILKKAEELRSDMHINDKSKNLLLSKKSKEMHKTIVKKDYGAVRGHVVSTIVMPNKDDLFEMTRAEFANVGQKLHVRRNKANYETFEQFSKDMKSIVFVDAGFEDEHRKEGYFVACSCTDDKSESGVKGKMCVHCVVVMMECGIIKENTEISNFVNKPGAAKKNEKQVG